MRSDSELVDAVLEGDKAAFAELVARYERAARAVCLNILHDRHLAADAAQEAFVSAYQKLGSLRDCKTFGPWLMQIARRCSLDILKDRRGEIACSLDINDQAAGVAWHATTGCAMQSSGNDHQLDEEKQILLAAVMKLADGEREAIMLRYFDSRSVQDVADIMGKGVGTITKQLSRAHAKLKVILERKQSLTEPRT